MNEITKKTLENVAENLTKSYLENLAFRGLMQFNPFSAIIDLSISSKYSQILISRNTKFFNELQSGDIEYSHDVIESNDFLHCFFISYNAAMRAKKDEKISMFAKILKRESKNHNIDTDEFEEVTQIIEDVSYREFLILSKIYDLEQQNPLGDEPEDNDFKRSLRFWTLLENYMSETLNIPIIEQEAILVRLARTGLYVTFRGLYMTDTAGIGKTTKLFERIIYILNQ